MATYQLPAVECFDFGKPGDWPSWVRRFERFREASGLKEKEEEAQVSALIYMMGDKAEDILRSFGLKDEDKKKYKVVRDRYEVYFVKKRNVIYERAKFNLYGNRRMENLWMTLSHLCIPWPSIATLETFMMK